MLPFRREFLPDHQQIHAADEDLCTPAFVFVFFFLKKTPKHCGRHSSRNKDGIEVVAKVDVADGPATGTEDKRSAGDQKKSYPSREALRMNRPHAAPRDWEWAPR